MYRTLLKYAWITKEYFQRNSRLKEDWRKFKSQELTGLFKMYFETTAALFVFSFAICGQSRKQWLVNTSTYANNFNNWESSTMSSESGTAL